MPLRHLPLAFCALLLVLPAAAAPPLSEALQSQLDRAVLDYESGRHQKARQAFEALAKRRVPAAEFNLALMHLQGELPRPDRAQARRLLERAAAGGFATAQLLLAQQLETGGFGGRRDIVAANRWFEKAALAGSVEGQVAMGTAYYLGRGAPKDPALAAQWFREAAKGGDIGAMYLLASMYEQGDGVERDLRLARYWYEAAARGGDEAAPGKVRELDSRP
jgi:uncharacterized protein